jgi:hypothetical protein
VHFFNRWPLPSTQDFLECYPNGGDPEWALQKQFALVDATPEYLFNSMAAPRMQAVVPQAKFVIILRVRAFRCMYALSC